MFRTSIYDFKLKVIVFFFLFMLLPPSPQSFANSPTNKEVEDLIIRGLDKSYNFKWDEAEQIFERIINKFPDDPQGYHYESSIYLWYFLNSKDKDEYENFLKYSDLAIEKANKLIEKNPDDKDLLYTIGADYTYRAIAFSKAENYLDAAWATKKSESYLSKLLETDSTYFDAYLGLGLYNFAVGQIPSAFKWALSLAGIDGDKKVGVNYIRKCAKSGYLSKIDAQYYLSQILAEVLFDYTDASNYLKNLVQKYPDNLIFNYSYASLEIKTHNLDQAQKLLDKIVLIKNKNFTQLIALSNFLLGDVYFKKNNFDSAIEYYLKFILQTPDNNYIGIASYRLGLCYEISGDTSSAKKFFEQAKNGNTDLDDDIYARRKGEIYSSKDLDSNEVKVILAANKIDAGKYRQAFKDLYELVPVIKESDLKAEVYLYLSDAAFKLGNYDESLKMGFAAQSLNPEEEKWVKPFAVFYIARAYKKMGNQIAYKNFLDEAEDYDDYDYENKLKNMIYALKIK
jgi:tetratricopeptide (TPR) repeat protein